MLIALLRLVAFLQKEAVDVEEIRPGLGHCHAFDAIGLKPRINGTFNGPRTLWRSAADSFGWTLGSRSMRARPVAGLVAVPIEGLYDGVSNAVTNKVNRAATAIGNPKDPLGKGVPGARPQHFPLRPFLPHHFRRSYLDPGYLRPHAS